MSEAITGPASGPARSPYEPPGVDPDGIAQTAPNPPRPAARSLYAVVWRWHFYAGLISAPILLLIFATGAIYVFRTEIVAWRDQGLQKVVPRGERKTFDDLRAIAEQALGTTELEGVMAHPDADRSVKFVAHEEAAEGSHDEHEERHRSVYLNPYNGDILGSRIDEDDFFAIVLDLHRTLMLGTTGRILSELATSWAVILLLSGVYLWWPRGKKNVGVWLPRIRGKIYAVLRDWHAVTGIYLAPLAMLIVGTGLFFTIVWGTAFNTSVKKIGHWAPQWFEDYKVEPPAKEASFASLDQLMSTCLAQARPQDTVMIRLAMRPGVALKAYAIQDENKNSYRMIAVNPYTAEKIAVVDGHELPFMYRVRLWAVSIHMGQIFGTPTKILALVTSLGLLLMSLTGIWMWWERRPQQQTGFPRRPQPRSLPAWGWGVVILTGLLLPVAGVSMLLIGLIDFSWARWRGSAA